MNKSFVQLGMVVGSGVMLIAVTPKLGVSTFPEFVALARWQAADRPGGFSDLLAPIRAAAPAVLEPIPLSRIGNVRGSGDDTHPPARVA